MTATTTRRLEAPHRRRGPGPRVVEWLAVRAFRATSWVLAHVPPGPAAVVIGLGAQLSYLAWPAKRAWSNANFGHVLGLPPGHRKVRRLALRAYRLYGRYLVEVMRLPSMTREAAAGLVRAEELDAIEPVWRESKGGLIFALGHVGNNEAVAAAVAWRGWPINVVADDSAYDELFEDFRKLRESWGIHVIAWRNLREIYTVLKRREMLALLVDWGYRPDGIPVRLFDAWTTLPAGPATLAAKTGSRILPVAIRRGRDGFEVSLAPPIEVASSEPAELQRATQAMADALAATVGSAPEQWYSFKPIWPETEAEQAELAARAAALLGAPERPPAPASPDARVGAPDKPARAPRRSRATRTVEPEPS